MASQTRIQLWGFAETVPNHSHHKMVDIRTSYNTSIHEQIWLIKYIISNIKTSNKWCTTRQQIYRLLILQNFRNGHVLLQLPASDPCHIWEQYRVIITTGQVFWGFSISLWISNYTFYFLTPCFQLTWYMFRFMLPMSSGATRNNCIFEIASLNLAVCFATFNRAPTMNDGHLYAPTWTLGWTKLFLASGSP